MSSGYAGSILIIDLTDGTWERVPLDGQEMFIGGRGINTRLLSDRSRPGLDPLSPDNPIVLGAGPLIGTLVPTACRLSVEFRNVITSGLGSGNAGGHFAAEMKYAGYDHIVITGKAPGKTYLYITNEEVCFRDAQEIWHSDTWSTELAIRSREKNLRLRTMCTGQAGINGVAFASIVVDRGRTVGYGGGGAIMASKNLKAIAVHGTGPVEVAHPKELLNTLDRYMKTTFRRSKAVQAHQRGGTLLPYQSAGSSRPHGVRNMSDEYWPDTATASISREEFDRDYVVQRKSCFACPVYCSSLYEVEGIRTEGFHANSFRAFGSNIDATSARGAFLANALTNRYGMDGDHTSSVIAWAIECFENGLITTADTDGLELRWGDIDTVITLIHQIARREGFGGRVLAAGLHEASRLIGRGSEKLAMLIKKNGLMEAATRTNKGWALGIMTSTKGGGHLRGAPGQEAQAITPEQSREIFGIDHLPEPTSYDRKAELVVWQERYKAITDSVGICIFSTGWSDVELAPVPFLCDLLELVTGISWSPEELMRAGERIQTVERMYNLVHGGFDRKDDMPPRKLMDTSVSDGRYRGEHLDEEHWNRMLDEYYRLHSWDIPTGQPTEHALREIGLSNLIESASGAGIELPQ
jgi:aldehyde:ferredoxin oxidoreductase